jgi:uncharacterized protein YigE (DUF2233 family)
VARHVAVPVVFRLWLGAAAAVAAGFVPLAAASASAAPHCRADVFEDARYTICSFDLTTTDVRVFWRKPDGAPYRTFAGLAQDLSTRGVALTFAINGGMFQDDFSPVGLFVENGVALRPVNRASAPARLLPVPNFYKQPNGVFYIAGGKAAIVTTDRYVKDRPKADFATQSGPMLVIDGKLHPAFRAGSLDQTRRSGVGVQSATQVVFVLSDDAVNFDEFARLFRDRLGCANALFLDGGFAPGIYAPELGRNDPPGHGGYGPIVAAVAKTQ